MTRRLLHIIIAIFAATAISSCHQIEEWDNDARGNFDALWTMIDQHYCFFTEKDVDWDEVYVHYSSRIYDDMPRQMLFNVCAEMLDELRDGHVNLSSAFNTSYYHEWWSAYPQNYDERLVQQYYLNFDYKSIGTAYYGVLPQNIGYLRYSTFSTTLGEGNIDAIINDMALCTGLIIDIRDNGGGMMTNAEKLAARFVRKRTLAGYMINKTGPGHNDFSEPYAYYFEPTGDGHLLWHKPVVVLTNRSTFSAANNFVSIMQYVPDTYIVGARTGGGAGMPLSMELPCGWSVRMSAVSILDAQGQTTEFGIEPTAGCAVDLDPQLALQGVDTMIERAIEVLTR